MALALSREIGGNNVSGLPDLMASSKKPQDFFFDRTLFRKRIKILGLKYGSINKLAKASHHSQTTINEWALGHRQPSISKIKEFAAALGINYLWLIEKTAPLSTEKQIDSIVKRVPLYTEGAAAGINGRIIGEPGGTISVGMEIIQATHASDEIYALRVDERGDSMEPDIPRGSIVIVDPVKGRDSLTFYNRGIYVIRVDDEGTAVKCVERRGKDLWIVSKNKAYKPVKAWTRELSELILGQVIYHFKMHV